ncbi:hypothetical protein DCAR_0831102 [Daucus carota subsp. sativus]|uniref:Integrase catalytic domain-containing protein n=1 Tax=Daucus carota subsp. sativus TaxID=79200 RepID=A0AAF0XQV8_DAUCS|nr:hypothetical protein DCAR_0831102 [Daucus carota subsp. sativus]
MPALQNVREDIICQGCQFGKSRCLPLQRSTNRRSTKFKLIHTDLMGPMKTTSYGGFRYVMIFVDDYSKYAWVNFLANKSETLAKFVEFQTDVEKEFKRDIKCLRSDNGGEFLSNEFIRLS